jgi:hypothetical protein
MISANDWCASCHAPSPPQVVRITGFWSAGVRWKASVLALTRSSFTASMGHCRFWLLSPRQRLHPSASAGSVSSSSLARSSESVTPLFRRTLPAMAREWRLLPR